MIDTWTISLASALVVVLTAALFIGSTIAHKDTEVGRIWAAGYLAGIIATASFLTWMSSPTELWWASAVGNTGLVVSNALFWVGCRRHNGLPVRYWVLVPGCLAPLVAGLLPGPGSDEWAGAHVYFACIIVFAVLAAVETRRGRLGRAIGSQPMTLVFCAEALFFAGRLVFFSLGGEESAIFATFFNSAATALVSMVLVIVLSNSMAVIRSELSVQGGVADRLTRARGVHDGDGVLTAPAFKRVLRDWLDRAEFHDEQLALFHFDLDDLDEINAALGRSHGNDVLAGYTAVVRRFGPPHSDIGVAGTGRLVLATPMASGDDALEAAATVQAGLLQESLVQLAGLRPRVSIGIALTDYTGFDVDRLSAAAMRACSAASNAGGNRVVLDTGGAGGPGEERHTVAGTRSAHRGDDLNARAGAAL